MTLPTTNEIRNQVQQALNEDLGIGNNLVKSGDVTASLIPENKISTAQLISRETAILCGTRWFDTAFELLNTNIKIDWFFSDGDKIELNTILCKVSGNARDILTAERSALNFLQTLSATATQTHYYVNAIAGTDCKILDTRKTIPGLRLAQKYAVTCGGGVNHRVGLYDMILIKENHIRAAGSITAAVSQARKINSDLKIEVEVENLEELEEALNNNIDRILLDNMNIEMLRQAVKLTNHKTDLEASGNITLENIKEIAETGVNYISTGALTKNVRAIDFSLQFIV